MKKVNAMKKGNKLFFCCLLVFFVFFFAYCYLKANDQLLRYSDLAVMLYGFWVAPSCYFWGGICVMYFIPLPTASKPWRGANKILFLIAIAGLLFALSSPLLFLFADITLFHYFVQHPAVFAMIGGLLSLGGNGLIRIHERSTQ